MVVEPNSNVDGSTMGTIGVGMGASGGQPMMADPSTTTTTTTTPTRLVFQRRIDGSDQLQATMPILVPYCAC